MLSLYPSGIVLIGFTSHNNPKFVTSMSYVSERAKNDNAHRLAFTNSLLGRHFTMSSSRTFLRVISAVCQNLVRLLTPSLRTYVIRFVEETQNLPRSVGYNECAVIFPRRLFFRYTL